MQEYRARAGSVIVIDVDTGEVLAMVNQPSYNPNDRDQLKAALYRNRAATDIFEPGSSIKPFIMAAALASGQYHAGQRGRHLARVHAGRQQGGRGRDNLGADRSRDHSRQVEQRRHRRKVALSLKPEQIWNTLTSLGFGQVTGSDYPGESAGHAAATTRTGGRSASPPCRMAMGCR